MNKKEFIQELKNIVLNYGAEKYLEYQKRDIKLKENYLKRDDTQDVIYNKTYKIININNINEYDISYPSKVNLHIDLKDVHQQLHDITIPTISKILNNKQELMYYINLNIKKTNDSYQYLQSSLENNWIIFKIKVIIYDTKHLKKKNIKIEINKYKLYIEYNIFLRNLYEMYLKIIKNKEIKLLTYNKYNIYLRYINIIQETLKLKPNKYKNIMIYNKNNKIILYTKPIKIIKEEDELKLKYYIEQENLIKNDKKYIENIYKEAKDKEIDITKQEIEKELLLEIKDRKNKINQKRHERN